MCRGHFQKTVACSVFLLLLGFHPAVVSAEEPPAEERNSEIVGKVIQSDGTPVCRRFWRCCRNPTPRIVRILSVAGGVHDKTPRWFAKYSGCR